MTFQWVVSSRTLNQPHKNKTSCNVVVDVDDVCDVVDNDDDVDVVVVELGQVRADSAGNFFPTSDAMPSFNLARNPWRAIIEITSDAVCRIRTETILFCFSVGPNFFSVEDLQAFCRIVRALSLVLSL